MPPEAHFGLPFRAVVIVNGVEDSNRPVVVNGEMRYDHKGVKVVVSTSSLILTEGKQNKFIYM